MRKIIVPAACAVAVLSAVAILAAYPDPPGAEPDVTVDAETGGPESTRPGAAPETGQGVTVDAETPGAEPHVVMPTKSSRPGCEEDGRCYIPEAVTAEAGQTIVWRNGDAAFHSVTSGTYEEPDGLFDSGHMDPDTTFSYTFDTPGTYVYHCTLHPWMTGVVDVR